MKDDILEHKLRRPLSLELLKKISFYRSLLNKKSMGIQNSFQTEIFGMIGTIDHILSNVQN